MKSCCSCVSTWLCQVPHTKRGSRTIYNALGVNTLNTQPDKRFHWLGIQAQTNAYSEVYVYTDVGQLSVDMPRQSGRIGANNTPLPQDGVIHVSSSNGSLLGRNVRVIQSYRRTHVTKVTDRRMSIIHKFEIDSSCESNRILPADCQDGTVSTY